MAIALGTHIVGIILGIVGLWLGAAFWAILSSTCGPYIEYYSSDHCACAYHSRSFYCKLVFLYLPCLLLQENSYRVQ